MVSTSTIGGWAVIAVAGACFYLYGSNANRNKKGRPVQPTNRRASTARSNDTSVSNGDQGNASQEATLKKRKDKKPKERKASATEQPKVADTLYTNGDVDDGDDEIDNREFARQLQSAKTGTLQTPRGEAGSKPKSVKQSRATNSAAPPAPKVDDKVAAAPAAERDNEATDAASPQISATKASSLDISDMLESPTAGPAVLRVTSPTNPAPAKKEKTAAPMQQVETKKQRQNRKKAEEAKAVREEDEKARRVLLEKQRRTAREAEGRSAKDGSTFMASKAPTTSAWPAPSTTTAPQVAASQKVELLDTSEPKVTTTNGPSKVTASSSEWQTDLPSEEEQLRKIQEETEWATVSKKKNRKNTTVEARASSESGGDVEKPAQPKKLIGSKKQNESKKSVAANAGIDLTQFDPSIDVNDPSIAWTKQEFESRRDPNYKQKGLSEVELQYQQGSTVVDEVRYLGNEDTWKAAPEPEEWDV
jgi:hypothetical protein